MPVLAIRMPLAARRGARRQALALDAESTLRLRVRYTDLDLYGHMNNGRFLTNMDLGRTDFVARTTMLRTFRTRRWKPLMAGATIRYRRPLEAFRRYSLRTRLLGWDGRWFVFGQVFEVDGKLAANAYAKVVLRDANGESVDAHEAMLACGWEGEPMPLPDEVQRWLTLPTA